MWLQWRPSFRISDDRTTRFDTHRLWEVSADVQLKEVRKQTRAHQQPYVRRHEVDIKYTCNNIRWSKCRKTLQPYKQVYSIGNGAYFIKLTPSTLDDIPTQAVGGPMAAIGGFMASAEWRLDAECFQGEEGKSYRMPLTEPKFFAFCATGQAQNTKIVRNSYYRWLLLKQTSQWRHARIMIDSQIAR